MLKVSAFYIVKNKKVLFLKKIFFKPYHQDRSKRWCLLSKFSVKVLAESMAESPESLLTHKKKIVWSDLHCSLQIFETNRLIIKLTTWAAQSSYYCMLSMFISIFLDVTHNLLMHSYNIFFFFFQVRHFGCFIYSKMYITNTGSHPLTRFSNNMVRFGKHAIGNPACKGVLYCQILICIQYS